MLRLAWYAAIVVGLLAGKAAAQPTIFNCSETANPGDVISIQGDSFGNTPQVWMLHVTGTEASLAPATQIAVLSATGALEGTGSNSYVSAVIPVNETPGLYAIWVSSDSGNTFSPGVFVNQAMPWNANDLCGTQVDPGRQFHIYGRNLEFPGYSTPAVNFVSGTASIPATVVSGTDPFVLSVTAPASLQNGTNYTLEVSNGFGGTYGVVAGPVLTGTITGGSDPFGLGVPWGADFALYSNHMFHVPFVSATTDMTAAIQTAINNASSIGGGVVALDSGTYQLSPGAAGGKYSYLTIKSNVVIKGAGMTQTVLLMSGTSINDPIGYHFGVGVAGPSLFDSGFSNLTLYNTPTGGSSGLSFTHNYEDRFFAVNTEFKGDVESVIFISGSQMLFKNCVVWGGTGVAVTSGTTTFNDAASPVSAFGLIDSVFENNYFQYYNGRVWFQDGCVGLLFLSNTISRIALSATLGETGGFADQQTTDTVVMGNTIERDTLSGTIPYWNTNDGESIMCQTGHNFFPCQGNVTSATPTTITDVTRDWTNDYSNPTDNQPYYVTIVKGPGAGQVRQIRSNTTTTLTIDTPWLVTPGPGSVYDVHHFEALRHLLKDNLITNQVQGFVYYAISIKDMILADNTLNNGGGIFIRSDWRPSTTGTFNEFDVQFDDLVTGNSVTVTPSNPYTQAGSWGSIDDYLVMVGTSSEPGIMTYSMEFRDNIVSAPEPNQATQNKGINGEGYGILATLNSGQGPMQDGTDVASIGAIFQDNTAISCSNAFHLCTGDYYTTIWSNSMVSCNAPLWDGTGSGTGHASRYTILGAPALPAPPSITSTLNVTGTSTYPFSYRITASNPPDVFTANQMQLPLGLGFSAQTGVISGTPMETGTFAVAISAANAGGTDNETLAITIRQPPPAITSTASITGTYGMPFNFQVMATGNPSGFNASGLPPGLVLSPNTGLISGTPTQSGMYSASISATGTEGSGPVAHLAIIINVNFSTLQGTYDGLATVAGTSRGFFTLTVNAKGSFSATLKLPGAQYSFRNVFAPYGALLYTVKIGGTLLQMTLGAGPSLAEISGTIIVTADNVSASYSVGGFTVKTYKSTTLPPTIARRYTFRIPAISSTDPTLPQAPGYGTMTVSNSGLMSLAGKLGDGTPFSATGQLGADGKTWTLFKSLYGGKGGGSLAGMLIFENLVGSDCDGVLQWIKPAQKTTKYYPAGFSVAANFSAAVYLPPALTGGTTAAFTLGGGNLSAAAISDELMVASPDKITVTGSNNGKVSFTLAPNTGLFTGGFFYAGMNDNRKILFGGVIYEKPGRTGVGLFLGSDQAGAVEISQ